MNRRNIPIDRVHRVPARYCRFMSETAKTSEAGFPATPKAVPRREAASAEITRHLLDYLLSGDLAPGQRLPSERQLADALQVGRSAVREAIKSLSLLGLLDVRQGDGTYLSRTDSELLPRVIEWGLLLGERRVYDLMEARTHLEITLAGLAAERRQNAVVTRLRELLAEMESAVSIADYVQADIAFHLEIAQASGNEVLAGLVNSIKSLLRVWAERVLESAGETTTSLAMHVPIVDAIEGRDVEASRVAMAAHMDRASRRLRETLAGAYPAQASIEG
ncbi:MAG: GntR family transcriptional regulator, transcriptional repressor for pyruvate dehydrogenase complex [Solirubrobacteraceae bacterium]